MSVFLSILSHGRKFGTGHELLGSWSEEVLVVMMDLVPHERVMRK